MADEPKPYKARCMYLTCKAMMVYGEDFESDSDYQAGAMDFTCNRTFQCQGPDGGAVGLELCSEPTRGCFREY
jgi:hypothetical protein